VIPKSYQLLHATDSGKKNADRGGDPAGVGPLRYARGTRSPQLA
jgi:hypothetical protein